MPGPICGSLAAARPRWLDKRPSAATCCCPDGSIAEPWGPPRGLTRQPCTGRRLRRNTTCHRPRQLRLPPNVQKHESIADGAQHLPAWRSHERNPAGHEEGPASACRGLETQAGFDTAGAGSHTAVLEAHNQVALSLGQQAAEPASRLTAAQPDLMIPARPGPASSPCPGSHVPGLGKDLWQFRRA